jgi:hypothetical protein
VPNSARGRREAFTRQRVRARGIIALARRPARPDPPERQAQPGSVGTRSGGAGRVGSARLGLRRRARRERGQHARRGASCRDQRASHRDRRARGTRRARRPRPLRRPCSSAPLAPERRCVAGQRLAYDRVPRGRAAGPRRECARLCIEPRSMRRAPITVSQRAALPSRRQPVSGARARTRAAAPSQAQTRYEALYAAGSIARALCAVSVRLADCGKRDRRHSQRDPPVPARTSLIARRGQHRTRERDGSTARVGMRGTAVFDEPQHSIPNRPLVPNPGARGDFINRSKLLHFRRSATYTPQGTFLADRTGSQ